MTGVIDHKMRIGYYFFSLINNRNISTPFISANVKDHSAES